MSKSNTEAEIREMARLTMLSNRINEIQEKDLRMFPYVFFDGVKTATVTFDLESMADSMDKRDTFIKYQLSIDPTVEITHREKRLDALAQATRNLFWNDLRVDIEILGEKK